MKERRSPGTTLGAAALALSVAAAFTACQPADRTAGEEDGKSKAEAPTTQTGALDSLRTAFEEAVAEGDFEAQAAFYTTDAILSMPGAGVIQGRDSIRAALQRTTPPGATLEIRPLEVRSLGSDWRYELGTGTFTFTPEGSDTEREMESTYLVLMKRTPDGWRLHREVLSPNAPPPGAQ